MTISYYTLGCKVNQYETEKIRGILEKENYNTSPFNEGGNIFVINTCTVTSVADGKSRAVIRKAKKINPKAFIIVTGCYSQTHREEVESLHEVDLVVDIKDKNNIPNLIKEKFPQKEETREISKLRNRTRAVLKVQDGCNQFCAYCLIPFARNHRFSEPISALVDEVKELCDNNYKEIVLTGIRLGSYNSEGKGLSDLIETLLNETKIDRIRLSSIEMWEINDHLIELMANSRMCNHLHIPLQNGNNEILKLMNRPYGREEYFALIEKLRNKVNDIGITTDVIAGFPCETDECFKDSYEFIKEIGFSRVHVFKYSRRPGTVADKMNGHIDPDIKKERVSLLTELGYNMSCEFAKKHIDKECNILFEIKKKDGFTYGYTTNYMEVKTDKPVKKNEIYTMKPYDIVDGILLV